MPQRIKFPFKIGADPEFCILLQHKLVHAEQFFKNIFADTNYEQQEFEIGAGGYDIPNGGNIGWDAHDATGEIRPLPAETADGLVKNIENIFTALTNKTKLFDLTTLSQKAPVGGHIHFELPDTLANRKVSVGNLHKKMSAFYVPLMLGENKLNIRTRRKSTSFGNMTDWRTEKHGNKWTYEFRVSSAEWLTTPKIAIGTLAYMACVYNEVINHPSNFLLNRKLIVKNDTQALALQELAIAEYGPLGKAVTNKIKKALRQFEFYEPYKQEIDYILTPAKVIRDKEKVNFNILQGWELIENVQPNKRTLLSERQLITQSKTVDLDKMSNLFNIQNNQKDTNLDFFVDAIKHRIITFNWKLKNAYFLFGLRKGINNIFVADKDGKIITGRSKIKTKLDFQHISEAFNKMSNKFSIEGTTDEERKPARHIMIGLPYELRIQKDTKKLIELIHTIEKGLLKAKTVKKSTLTDDTSLDDGEEENLGKIARVYQKEETNEIEVGASTRYEDNAREVEREIRNEERALNDETKECENCNEGQMKYENDVWECEECGHRENDNEDNDNEDEDEDEDYDKNNNRKGGVCVD